MRTYNYYKTTQINSKSKQVISDTKQILCKGKLIFNLYKIRKYSQLLLRPITVSYTHLDVYKRQKLYYMICVL